MRFFKHVGLRGAWDMSEGGMLFLVCCGLALFIFLSLLCDCRPVVDRQLLPFLASPRNGSKRRRRKVAVLAGYPIMQLEKWEMKQTRCAQTASLLIHFPPRTIGSSTCEF
jgi:hypothetical protein